MLCSVFHGFRVGPYANGSVVGMSPNSGVFVFPTSTNPAARSARHEPRVVIRDVAGGFQGLVPVVERVSLGGPVEVLDHDGNAPERSVRQRPGCLGARPLEARMDHCVQLGIELLDPCDRGVDELER